MYLAGILKKLCQLESVISNFGKPSEQAGPPGCRIHILLALMAAIMDKPIAITNERV
jgi:hypothetical protein